MSDAFIKLLLMAEEETLFQSSLKDIHQVLYDSYYIKLGNNRKCNCVASEG